ncbi:MAG: MlaD family protein [Bacteroidales bacterium]|nr:MlaD family protein [Bacteroidales bacterium]
MKKLSNEVRVGTVAIVIIVAFIWLFSFLKGKNILNSTDKYYIVYNNIAGLEKSNPVEINGYKAGIVQYIELVNDGSGQIIVTINITRDLRIPYNSVAIITTQTLIAGMKIEILLGDKSQFYSDNDTIPGELAVSLIEKLETDIDPLLMKTDLFLARIDTLAQSLNALLSPEVVGQIKESSDNINSITTNIDRLLTENSSGFSSLIDELDRFSTMLSGNRQILDTTISNIFDFSKMISGNKMTESVNSLSKSIDETSLLLSNLNKGEGSAGKLITDDSLYINLSTALENLNILLIDLRNRPEDYVHFSLFGGKNKK